MFKPGLRSWSLKSFMQENPFELELLEHMKGYPGKYKIRIGQYRIGVSLNKKDRLIICERIAHRKDIYKLFP